MRTLELEIEGVKVVARLLDKDAPETCQALWDVLPLEDQVIHSHWAGGRLHTTHHPDLNLDLSSYPRVENASSYQGPGDVIVEPTSGEINVVYAPGQYKWTAITMPVTRIAVIEGDMTPFAQKIERLQWEGAKWLTIRRGKGGSNPAPPRKGVRIQIECEGVKLIGELFEDRAPKLVNAILDMLPFETYMTNMHTSGNTFHVWKPIPNYPKEVETKRERPPTMFKGKHIGDSAVAFYDPREGRGTYRGDILADDTEGLRLVHGEVQTDQSQFTSSSKRTQKAGHIIEGDIDAFHAISSKIDWEGAKLIKVSKL